MQIRFNNNKIPKQFQKKDLPELYVNLVCKKLQQPEYHYMLSYIEENYKLSLNDLLKMIKENYQVARYEDLTVISFNNNIKYVTDKSEEIYLLTLLKLINYGNLDIHGTNIFTQIANYMKDNLGSLYDYMWITNLKGGERK